MKVLEVTDFYFPWIGGPSRFIDDLARGLIHRGHSVCLVGPSPTGQRYVEDGSVPIHRVQTWPIPVGYRLRAGAPFLDMDRIVADYKPDVVHVHHPFPISGAGMMSARRRRIPVVATNHTIPSCSLYGLRDSPLYRPSMAAFGAYLTRFLAGATTVTTPTATAAHLLRDLGFGGDVVPISNGVDTVRFSPKIGRTDGAAPTVLYTGRLDAEKDVSTLLKAIPHVIEEIRARFVIGGEGSDRPRLQRLARDLEVLPFVRFPGYATESDLPRLYQDADVYVMPSPVELQSISTLEAMACGLAVVAADAAALPELVQPGINGYLFPGGNAEALGRHLVSMLSDPRTVARMGHASRTIAEGHDHAMMVDRYERVLLASTHLYRPTQGAAFGPARG